MQIKHTFLFTLILGLGWTMYVFAYATGPDPGENGLFGENCTSCHTGRVNSGSGAITVSGLPTSWTTGQTYPLTVTVPKPGTSHVYGFQLSAVADSTNQQAGSLARGPNVQVICGNGAGSPLYPGMNCSSPGAIQFAEHLTAGASNTYTFNWTAPSSASVGTVRFNVAANAGNGDATSNGDLIYTTVIRVAADAPPPPPPDLSTHAFTIVDRGGMSIITDGSGAQTAGYSSISPAAGSSTPTGVAIFGFRNASNILVSETGVPATPLLTQGRIYAEVAGTLDTGVAIANPNSSPATINFSFTNAAGASAGSGTTTIQPNQQIAQFLDQPPLKVYSGTTFQGTFNFTSSVPVGVVALRGLTNERGDFLMSTLPVIDTTATPATGTAVIPHFADGAGWTTQIFLVNPTSNLLSGTVKFTDTNGAATSVTIGGTTNSSFSYSIPAGSSQKLATAGTAGTLASGSVAVVPGGSSTTPVALVVFSYKPAGVTVSEAGVPVTGGSAFRLYVESSGATGQVGSIATGLAVAGSSATVTFDITDLNGASIGVGPVSISLPASGQTAKFLSDIFPTGLPNPFKGILRITTNGSISVVGLRSRTNERSDFLITTTPASNETGIPANGDLLFPHLVNGGGYTTQFILFSGTAGQTSSGNLHFFEQGGSPFNLTVN